MICQNLFSFSLVFRFFLETIYCPSRNIPFVPKHFESHLCQWQGILILLNNISLRSPLPNSLMTSTFLRALLFFLIAFFLFHWANFPPSYLIKRSAPRSIVDDVILWVSCLCHRWYGFTDWGLSTAVADHTADCGYVRSLPLVRAVCRQARAVALFCSGKNEHIHSPPQILGTLMKMKKRSKGQDPLPYYCCDDDSCEFFSSLFLSVAFGTCFCRSGSLASRNAKRKLSTRNKLPQKETHSFFLKWKYL